MNCNYYNQGGYQPSIGTPLQMVDFESIWKSQINIDPNAPKGSSGLIYSTLNEKRCSILDMLKGGVKNNGLIFVDIDHLDNNQKMLIFNHLDDINRGMAGWIYTAVVTGGGMHVVMLGEPMNLIDYKIQATMASCLFDFHVERVCGIKLSNIEKCIDLHNSQFNQCFFLRPTKYLYWNDQSFPVVVGESNINKCRTLYPDVWKSVDNKIHEWRVECGLIKRVTAPIRTIQSAQIDSLDHNCSPDKYMEHRERWTLFESICGCTSNENEAIELWMKVCEHLVEGNGHGRLFYEQEPIKNKWYMRWENKEDKYINHKLLQQFGIYIKNKKNITK